MKRGTYDRVTFDVAIYGGAYVGYGGLKPDINFVSKKMGLCILRGRGRGEGWILSNYQNYPR